MNQITFFIHAVDSDNTDLMTGPFITSLTQDQIMDEALTAFAGTNYKPKAFIYNVGICRTAPELKKATNWRGRDSLSLFGIMQESSQTDLGTSLGHFDQ